MKIKCVSNIDCYGKVSDHLTVGKIYDMTPYDEKNDAGDIVNDTGEDSFIYLPDCSHGKWEVVE